MNKLEISLQQTATKFLFSLGLNILDYDKWLDGYIYNKCLIIKSETYYIKCEKTKNFDSVFAPLLEGV